MCVKIIEDAELCKKLDGNDRGTMSLSDDLCGNADFSTWFRWAIYHVYGSEVLCLALSRKVSVIMDSFPLVTCF